jgi:ABC-type dipeptide/oligopeptide/nickel transport system permease component
VLITAFVLRRGAWALLSFVLVAFMLFSVFTLLAGDYFSPNALKAGTEDEIAAARESFGLNDPLPLRFARWFAAVLSGHFGASPFSRHPFDSDPLSRPPWPLLFTGSMVLTSVVVFCSGLLLALLVGTLSGIRSVTRASGLWAVLHRWSTRIGSSVPGFLWAFGLLLLVSMLFHDSRLGLHFEPFPAGSSGYGVIAQWPAPTLRGIAGIAWRVVLSWFVVCLPYTFHVSRHAAHSARTAIASGPFRAARAHGTSDRRAAWRHVLRPTLMSVLSSLPVGAAYVLFGSLIAARVLGLPTFGRVFLYTLFHFPSAGIILSGLVTYSAVLVAVRFLSEVLGLALDPRARHPQEASSRR